MKKFYALMLGVALCPLALGCSDSTKKAQEDALKKSADDVKAAADKATDAAKECAAEVKKAADDATSAVKDAASDAKNALEEAADKAKKAVE